MRSQSIAVLLWACAASASCQGRSRAAARPSSSDRSIVEGFVHSDTLNDEAAAERLYLPLGDGVDFCELAFDGYFVTSFASITPLTPRGDTSAFAMQFTTLGTAWSDEGRRGNTETWHFRPSAVVKIDTLLVATDSGGRRGIVCGPRVPPNHLGIEAWRRLVPRLDSASRISWSRVWSGHGR